MKKLLFIHFALVMGISTSHAQFGTLGKLYKTAKSAAAKNKKQAQDDYGNKKIIDIFLLKTHNSILLTRLDGQLLQRDAVFGIAFSGLISISATAILHHNRCRFSHIGNDTA